MPNFINEPVLGQAGVKMTMSDPQALAYCLLWLSEHMDLEILKQLELPKGYSYVSWGELLAQARDLAQEILKPLTH